ncbi:MAG: InlB B-repeat-containing protein [Eubacterium sp.]|nr:InlB B-repeat-containing protein [Eubacterium sp.]
MNKFVTKNVVMFLGILLFFSLGILTENANANGTYTITLDASGGNFSGASTKKVKMPSEAGLKLTNSYNPKKTDCTFLGWSKDKNSKKVSYTVGSVLPRKTATYYAVWRMDYYYITFEGNGGDYGSSTTKKVKMPLDAGLKLTNSYTPSRARYIFMGWSTNKDAVTPSYGIGDSLPKTTASYWAVWKADFYNLKLYPNGGNFSDSGSVWGNEPKITQGKNIYLKMNNLTPSRGGYSFLGWSKDGSDIVSYEENSIISILKDTSLYAVWDKETKNVDYSYNVERNELIVKIPNNKAGKAPESSSLYEIDEKANENFVTSVNGQNTFKYTVSDTTKNYVYKITTKYTDGSKSNSYVFVNREKTKNFSDYKPGEEAPENVVLDKMADEWIDTLDWFRYLSLNSIKNEFIKNYLISIFPPDEIVKSILENKKSEKISALLDGSGVKPFLSAESEKEIAEGNKTFTSGGLSGSIDNDISLAQTFLTYLNYYSTFISCGEAETYFKMAKQATDLTEKEQLMLKGAKLGHAGCETCVIPYDAEYRELVDNPFISDSTISEEMKKCLKNWLKNMGESAIEIIPVAGAYKDCLKVSYDVIKASSVADDYRNRNSIIKFQTTLIDREKDLPELYSCLVDQYGKFSYSFYKDDETGNVVAKIYKYNGFFIRDLSNLEIPSFTDFDVEVREIGHGNPALVPLGTQDFMTNDVKKEVNNITIPYNIRYIDTLTFDGLPKLMNVYYDAENAKCRYNCNGFVGMFNGCKYVDENNEDVSEWPKLYIGPNVKSINSYFWKSKMGGIFLMGEDNILNVQRYAFNENKCINDFTNLVLNPHPFNEPYERWSRKANSDERFFK